MLSKSSFFLAESLSLKAQQGTLSAKQLAYGLSLALPNAYQYQLSRLDKTSARWRDTMTLFANHSGEASYQLARYYQQHVNEQDQGSRGELNPNRLVELFYLQAIRLGYHSAAIDYAFWLNAHQQTDLALAQLTPFLALAQQEHAREHHLNMEHSPIGHAIHFNDMQIQRALNLAITLELAHGDIDALKKLLPRLKRQFNPLLKQQLRTFNISHIIKHAENDIAELTHNKADLNFANKTTSMASCDNKIQFFATRLADLEKSKQLISDFSSHPLSEFFCFAIPRYIPITQLNCQNDPASAISCEEGVWHGIELEANSRYIALMLPHGKANVHLGIAYFDSDDDALVLAHEFAHFLGLIDEYALAPKHAACEFQQAAILAPNVIKLKQGSDNAPFAVPWQALTNNETTNNDFKGAISKTCTSGEYITYKPSDEITFMERYQAPYPQLYHQLLRRYGAEYAMPSYHYNIAYAQFKQGKVGAAKKQLKLAAAMEKNIQRRDKIAIGAW